MLSRIKAGWHLTGKSWQTLRSNKHLILFPLASSFASLFFLLLLLLPFGGLAVLVADDVVTNDFIFYPLVFLFLLLSTYIAVFFNAALVSQVAASFRGEETGFRQGLLVAWSKKGVILKWSLLAAFVGTVLRVIQDRLPFAGGIIAFLGGLAWAVASWFVIPILVLEDEGPIDALKNSASTVKKRWGEGVTGVIVIGGIFTLLAFVLILLGILLVILTASVSAALAVTLGVIFFFFIALLGFISSTLRQIFDTAVYLSIQGNGESVGLFTRQDIESAVVQKRQKGNI